MKNILWLYNENAQKHPFIVIAATALAQSGFNVSVVNSNKTTSPTHYQTLNFFPERIKSKVVKSKSNARISLFIALHSAFIKRDGKKWTQYKELQKKHFRVIKFLLKEIWFKPYRRLRKRSFDIIIGTRTEAAILGLLLAKTRGNRFIYYPFEVMYEQGGGKTNTPYGYIIRMCEYLLLKFSDALITQNECRAKIYKEERKCSAIPTIVHNYKPWHPQPQSGKLRQHLGDIAVGKKIVLYEGNLMQRRWLDKVVQASPLVNNDILIVMMGSDRLGWAETHHDILSGPIAKKQLIILPEVSHDDLLSYVVDAEVGIIIYDDKTRNNFFCEPGKLSDYIMAGVPVIAPDFPTLGPVIRHYNIGVCFKTGDPEMIAQAINDVISSGKDSWKPALQRAAKELCWENQYPAFLSAILGSKPQ